MIEIIVLVVSAIINGVLGLFVFLKNTKSATSRLFFGLTLTLVAWSLANYISVHPIFINQIVWVRLVLFFAALLNLFVLLTFQAFPSQKLPHSHVLRTSAIIYTLVVMVLTLTPLVFSGLDSKGSPVPAPGIVLFLIQTVASLGGGTVLLLKKYLRSKGLARQQFKYVLMGITGTFSLIFITNFVIVAFLHTTLLLPLGPAYTLIFSGCVAYAIVRHRLLDIRAVVARSVTYVLLLTTLAALYSVVLFGLSSLVVQERDLQKFQTVIYLVLTMIFALSFQPLRRFFEHLTSRLFYRDKYDSQEVLTKIGKILSGDIVLEHLLDKSLKEICVNLASEMGQFMIFEGDSIYKVAHYGPLPEKLMVVPEMQKLRQSIIVFDELEGGERKEILGSHGVRVSVMLRTHEEFVGFLFLGDKLSGDIYSDQDLKLLEILANEIAVAVVNAKAYEEIQQFAETLQVKVDQATKNLRVANRNLKALDKAKDEFISMASHQLRTPLTTIKGYLSMMLEGDAGKVSPQQKEFLDYAFGGAERMVSLISDLLNVSRLAAGRFLIEKQPTDMVTVVADEIRQLQSHAAAKHLDLIFDQPKGKVPLINIDEGKTRQVIMNFIDNAIYYTKQGSVTVSLEYDKNAMRVKVRDTGIGVPEAAKEKLFGKFFRAENAQVARPDGTGLGLYLAKKVVEEQGGTIIFESKEGEGSTFGFEMPFKASTKK